MVRALKYEGPFMSGNQSPYAPVASNTNQIAGFRWGVPLRDTQELRVLLYRLGWAPVPGCPDVWSKQINNWRDAKLLLGPNSLEVCLHLPRLRGVSAPYLDYLFYVGVEIGQLLALAQTIPALAKAVSPGPAQHNLSAPFLRSAQEVWSLLKAARTAQGLEEEGDNDDAPLSSYEDDEDDDYEDDEDDD